MNKNINLNKSASDTKISAELFEWNKPETIKEQYDIIICSDVM